MHSRNVWKNRMWNDDQCIQILLRRGRLTFWNGRNVVTKKCWSVTGKFVCSYAFAEYSLILDRSWFVQGGHQGFEEAGDLGSENVLRSIVHFALYASASLGGLRESMVESGDAGSWDNFWLERCSSVLEQLGILDRWAGKVIAEVVKAKTELNAC